MSSSDMTLQLVYGDAAPAAAERFAALGKRFTEAFGEASTECFSAPGRTEIIGNHTDHNGGKILAASITMDTVAVAAPSGNSTVTIISEGYPDPIVVDIDKLADVPHCQGSVSLVAGMLVAAREKGYEIGGFNATVSSEVIPAAGVSSSASFEMLVCAIIDHLFNGDAIDTADYARIGQYAENHYWDKASGLMDQMACAVGGTIYLDFSDGVSYEKVDFSYSGAQAGKLAQAVQEGKVKLGDIHTYLELFGRYFIDLIPRVALVAAYQADKEGNLYTGSNTEDTPVIVEATKFKQGIVIASTSRLERESISIAFTETRSARVLSSPPESPITSFSALVCSTRLFRPRA